MQLEIAVHGVRGTPSIERIDPFEATAVVVTEPDGARADVAIVGARNIEIAHIYRTDFIDPPPFGELLARLIATLISAARIAPR